MISYCWWCQNKLTVNTVFYSAGNKSITMICINHDKFYIEYNGIVNANAELRIDHAMIWITPEAPRYKTPAISVYFNAHSAAYFYNNYNSEEIDIYQMKGNKFISQPIEKSLKIFDIKAFL